MENIKRKFYSLGVGLTLVIALALVAQYGALSKNINDSREYSIDISRNHLAHEIQSAIEGQITYNKAISQLISIRDFNNRDLEDMFDKLVEANSYVKSIYFGSPDNKLIISSGWAPPEDFDLRQRQWYKEAISEDKIFVSDMYLDAIDNGPVVAISNALFDKQGRLKGVLGIDIAAEEIIRMVEEATVNGLGYSFLMDGSGKIIVHPKYKDGDTDKKIYINYLGESIYQEIKNSKTGNISTKFENEEGFLSYEPLEGTNWIIVNFMSREEFMSNRWDSWNMIVSSLIIGSFIFIIFFYLQNSLFILPVNRLDSDIKKIDIEANMGYRLPVDENKPLVELRRSINHILNKTSEYFQQIEQANEEISAQNEELEASYSELAAMEEELREQYDHIIQSEEKLRKVLEKNQAIMDVIPDTMFVFNREGIYMDALIPTGGSAFKPKEEIIGKNIKDLVYPDLSFAVVERISKVLDSGVMEAYEDNLEDERGKRYFESRMVKLNEEKVLTITRNVTDRKEMEEKLINLSYHDQLTGLYNRRFFEEELRRLDTERNLPITLVMADVNGLKLINDSFGHKAGDDLLINIARIMESGCRADDIVSRVSGDEFIILLPKTTEEEAKTIVQRIKKIALEESGINSKDINLDLSISFGIGTKFNSEVSIDEVYKKAEDNMYAHKLLEGPSMRSKTIETIVKALYEKSSREENHSKRVSLLCQDIGKALNMDDEKIRELESVGLLHDIGKIAINEMILDKPGKLTSGEWEEMQKHPEIGYRILSTVNEMSKIAEYVLYHHERYDGRGYPKGLKANEIPLVSRIITIADAYDAMAADRPYRKALSHQEIVSEIINNAGTQFDPHIARVFVEKVLDEKWL